jgi:hypothetical protein
MTVVPRSRGFGNFGSNDAAFTIPERVGDQEGITPDPFDFVGVLDKTPAACEGTAPQRSTQTGKKRPISETGYPVRLY